jgi:hypothetical protein
MADISKIQIQSGIYEIKDETARNRLNTLNNELIFRPRNYEYCTPWSTNRRTSKHNRKL